ncbi:protein of unknown function [Aminobacter niigataensis]|nr:protein of unknown function [Aminobacter niigataensis]
MIRPLPRPRPSSSCRPRPNGPAQPQIQTVSVDRQCIAIRSRRDCRIGERLTLCWNEIMVTDLG